MAVPTMFVLTVLVLKKRDRKSPDENSPPSDLMQYVNEPLMGIQKEIKYSNVSNIIKCT
jgi:hypothetical protein